MRLEHFKLTNPGVTLTAYIPDVEPAMKHQKKPAMLVIPGGAYCMCSEREAEPIALAYLAKGYCTFVLIYSVGEGKCTFPTPLDDADEAMQLIVDHSEEWSLDKDRIAAIGFSAGGHLCACLGTMGKIKPAAVVLAYACTLEARTKTLCEPMPDVVCEVNKDSSPAFIFATANDDCVPVENSIYYAEALRKAGVEFEMHIFSRGYHGFSLANELVYASEKELDYCKDCQPWFELSVTWLNKIFYG